MQPTFEWGIFNLHVFEFKHYAKKGCFIIGLATQFLSYNDHLQLTMSIVQLNTIQYLKSFEGGSDNEMMNECVELFG
jgi:hypothetical protein